ncbi:unnamed protein product [Urochloa humidicola]
MKRSLKPAMPGGPTPNHKRKDHLDYLFTGIRKQADSAARSFRDPGGSSQRSTGARPHQLLVFVPSDPQKDQLSRSVVAWCV